jgi:hypothetical protein
MVTVASILTARAPALMVDCRHLGGRGWALALTGIHHRLGGASIHAGDSLGLLLAVTLIVA